MKNTLLESRRTIFLGMAILFIILFSANLSAFDWTDNIRAYYKFDETSGDIYDYTGNGNTLTGNSLTYSQLGKINTAINTTTVYNSIANRSGNLSITGYPFSFQAWVKIPNTSAERNILFFNYLITLVPEGIDYGLSINNTGYLKWVWRNNSGSGDYYSTNVEVDNNNWYHLVVVANNSTHRNLYVNGISISNRTSDISLNLTSPMQFGVGSALNGTVDEVGVWNRSLTSADVIELYNGGSGLGHFLNDPTIRLNSPSNNTELLIGEDYLFNCTTLASNVTNMTLYINGTANYTVYNTTISQQGINLNTSLIFYNTGSYNYSCSWVNSTGYQYNATSPYNFSMNKLIFNSVQYTASTTEGNTERFNLNLSLSPLYQISTGYLNYNAVSYLGSHSSIGANDYNITREITIPDISSLTNLSFNWSVTLNDSSNYITNTYNQTVSVLGLDNCSTFTTLLYNYTMKDEQTQTIINGTLQNASIEVLVNIYSLNSANPIVNYSRLYSNTSNARVCINSTLVNANYLVDATAKYYATDYQTEYNVIRRGDLTSANLGQNISLLILPSSVATIFQIIYKDASFIPVSNVVIDIARQYVSENAFKTIERPLTDVDGKATASLVINSGIYNIYVYDQEELVATYLNVIPVCQTPAITDCKIDLNSFSSSITVTNFTSINDFLFTLSHSKTARQTISTFTIPSGTVATIVLNVSMSDALGTNVCSQSITTSAGSLTCTYGSTIGNGTLLAKIYKNGVLVAQGSVSLAEEPRDTFSGMMVFIGLFIFLTILGLGLSDSGVMTAIFLAVGIILIYAMNLVSNNGFIGATATVLYILIAIIIVIIKGTNRQ